MDDTTGDNARSRAHGFAHERLHVLPRPIVDAAARAPITRRAVVTDAGWFPRAAGHLRTRPEGADELIVLVCVSGSGWVEGAGSRTRVAAGASALLPPRAPHAYGASSDDPWTIWWCHVRGTDVADFLDDATSPTVTPLRSLDRTVALFDALLDAVERGTTPAHLLAASGIAWHLLAQLAADRTLPASGTPLHRAMRHLEERVSAHVPVGELAALVGLSPSHLTSLFRQATGGGITSYHTGVKMARARDLLDSSDLSVAAIAREVGYPDPLYFSRRFQSAHGMSPTAYRAQRKG